MLRKLSLSSCSILIFSCSWKIRSYFWSRSSCAWKWSASSLFKFWTRDWYFSHSWSAKAWCFSRSFSFSYLSCAVFNASIFFFIRLNYCWWFFSIFEISAYYSIEETLDELANSLVYVSRFLIYAFNKLEVRSFSISNEEYSLIFFSSSCLFESRSVLSELMMRS